MTAKKSRNAEEQIAFALKQAETDTPVAEVLRRMGISEQTFHRWKKLYAGCKEPEAPSCEAGWSGDWKVGTGELRRLTQLEEKNRKLSGLWPNSA